MRTIAVILFSFVFAFSSEARYKDREIDSGIKVGKDILFSVCYDSMNMTCAYYYAVTLPDCWQPTSITLVGSNGDSVHVDRNGCMNVHTYRGGRKVTMKVVSQYANKYVALAEERTVKCYVDSKLSATYQVSSKDIHQCIQTFDRNNNLDGYWPAYRIDEDEK